MTRASRRQSKNTEQRLVRTARKGRVPVRVAAVVLLVFAAGIGRGFAQAEHVELVPLVGFRSSVEFTDKTEDERWEFDSNVSFGLILDINLDGNGFIELYAGTQPTTLGPRDGTAGLPVFDVNVDYFQIGGLYQWDKKPVLPFINVLLGVASFRPSDADVDPEVAFSFSVGTGIKAYFNKRWGLRADLRVFGTAVNGEDEWFCGSGTCLDVKGTILFQPEISVGVVIGF